MTEKRRYEVLILTVPEITKDEASAIEERLTQVVGEHDGEALTFDRWGKYLLAYAVRNYDYGIYFLMRFEVPVEKTKTALEAMQHALKVRYNDIVMRELFQNLSLDASLDYQRPESLEEAPEREVGPFFREKKTPDYIKGDVKRPHAETAKKAPSEQAEAQVEEIVEEQG